MFRVLLAEYGGHWYFIILKEWPVQETSSTFHDGRSISFKYGDTVSTREYFIGCPNGSNSGPLFWLLIVNDALEMDFGQELRILAYEDDIYLFVAATGKHNVKKFAEAALGKLQDCSA
ncbi:hypothetical protein AVEN_138108-1 [Araneus ventricosus]|uniref:Reverse transcriptase domain-containing protein n=1 Tax=Araneus ventricosus TaxID=182803 RepID=A0A4Y2QII1_ARAVE|nr:hypothetical protein AVEN_138108-1 [Araneus ventricosus]